MGILKEKNDWVQLGILLVSGVAMLGGFWAYCESKFASKEALNIEVEERKEMKGEVDALYLKLIPAPQRERLQYPRYGK
jgi:hypothetical protein